MKSKKATRRALLTSVMALILCCAMLVGSTFAWFTDSVTSANNIIKSGNLDVEVYNGLTTNDKKLEEVEKLFSKVELWEPGVVSYENLTVANLGTLALKYDMGVNFTNENNVGGYKLSQILKVAVVKGGVTGTDRDALVAGIDNWQTMADFSLKGELYPAGTEGKDAQTTYGLVIYWEPSADDNNWNVNNDKVTSDGEDHLHVDLGINLFATQLMAEKDSFGPDYDENATYYDVLVTTADELYAAVEAASGDIVIAIDGNIVLTKALSKSGLNSIKFVAYDDDAVIDQATYNMHFMGAKVTFEGLTLTHGEKAYGNGGQTSTAFAVWDAKEVNYLNCTFNRSVGTIHAALHNFIGCTFNGVENPDNSKSEYPLYICDGQDYNVIDCVFNCTNRGAILFYNDGGTGTDTLNISNTKFFGDIIADKTAVEIHNNSASQVYNVNIKDVIIGDGVINGLYRIKPANVGEVNVNVDGVTEVATASTATELTAAIENAEAGDTVVLDADVNVGTTQLALDNGITLDLNGNELTTNNNWGGMTITNGAGIKNGTINHPGNTAAIKVSGKIGTIENVVINITPTAGKTKTGIQVYNGKTVEAIKNVTITGATQGIEVAKGSRVDLIENVHVTAVADGAKKGVALLVNAASVGKAVNCTFEGDYGVYMMLNGEFHVALELDNCTVTGSAAALIAHDETGISNTTNCSLTLTYDAETQFNGDFVWSFEDECLGVVTLNKP